MNIIHSLKSEALSFPQLQFLAGKKQTRECRWILYDELQKFKDIDELMELGAVIILLQIEKPRASKVGHFIILLKHPDHIEHFDSYGIRMDEELELTQEHHLTKIFNTSRLKIVDNTKRLQTFREDINTCGRWVVARLLLRHIELDRFLNIFYGLDNIHSPDDRVTSMTILLQYDKD